MLGKNYSILQTLEGDFSKAKAMTEDRLPLTSQNVLEDKIAALRDLFPEVFAEGKVDFERLKQALGESIYEGRERYGLSWAGKSEAIQNLQVQSVGTLTPVPEESVNFETTENIFIEGDNLEVLKLLQKSYHNQIKMIYIDPPYNTGKEFIYPDNFREGLEDYLRYSGQKNGDGIKLTTNTETDGRFHSKWLNMMYPRLFLARNLLRDDGVIFVSIDDHEVHNLRILMNEIFGEENFIDCIVWKKRYGGGAKEKYLVTLHEYVLFYSKNITEINPIFIANSEDSINKYYKYEDENYERRGAYRTHPLEATKSMGDRPNLVFPIISPDGSEIFPKRQWLWSKDRVDTALSKQEIAFLKDKEGNWSVHTKQYLRDEQGVIRQSKAFSIIEDVFTQHGTNEIIDMFGNAQFFSFPKPKSFILRLLSIGTEDNEENIVLDFFAGSSTTAHAILEQNKEDGVNRKFIMVQLPEVCDVNSEACNAGYKTIADLGKERIRRAIKKIAEQENGKLDLNGSGQHDRGFKVFKLTESNFKIWDGTAPKDVEQLKILLQEFAENIRPGTTKLGMLYEILLKAGFPLTAKVEKLEIAGQEIYAVEDQELFLCLEYEILEETVRQILTCYPKPKQFISLDSSFCGNDQLKTNTQLQMRDHDIKFRTV